MDMIRVAASQFKARLGRYMRAVREGKEIVVTDRTEPVARFVPYREEEARPGIRIVKPRDPDAPPLGRVKIRGIPYCGPSTTAMLQEDRRR
jgi:prevent-host-death family protein